MPTDLTAFRPSLQPASEPAALNGFLTFNRRAAIARIEDLSDAAAARQPLPATNLSVGGVIKHLARTEDGWFTRTFAGEPMPEPWSSAAADDRDWPFTSSSEDTVDELIALYEAAIVRSDAVVARADSIDALAAQPSFGKGPVSLRYLLGHMVTETAWHLGHLDLLRDALGAPHPPD